MFFFSAWSLGLYLNFIDLILLPQINIMISVDVLFLHNLLSLYIHYGNVSIHYTEIFLVEKIENVTRKILIFFLFLLKT